MSQVFLSTTGTPTNVTINDLGGVTFVHPLVDLPLISPDGEWEVLDISNSQNLVDAVTAGEITLKDASGASITTMNDLNTGSSRDSTAIHWDIPDEFDNVIEKTSVVNGDWLLIEDSVDSLNKKKIQIGNIPSTGDVTSSANITDNTITRGDGGVKGIQDSIWTIADDGFMDGMLSRVGYAFHVDNTLGSGGGNGIWISGGEIDGDIVLKITDADETFDIMEIDANQGTIIHGETWAALNTLHGAEVYGYENHRSGFAADINLENGNYRIGREIVPIQQTRFTALDLDFPNSSNWAVNAFASISSDTINNALRVRRFDDTTPEGVGFLLDIPINATSVVIRLTHRRQSGSTAQNVVLDLWEREIPDNAAVTTWGNNVLGTIAVPGNTNWQKDTFNVDIGTMGLTAGSLHQFELVREGGDVSDTLVGDWVLLYAEVDFI